MQLLSVCGGVEVWVKALKEKHKVLLYGIIAPTYTLPYL